MTFTDLPGYTKRTDFTQFVHGHTNGDFIVPVTSYDRLYLADCIDGMGNDAYDADDNHLGIKCSLTRDAWNFACQMAS